MTEEELHEALVAEPFRPFLVRMTDDALYLVADPQNVAWETGSGAILVRSAWGAQTVLPLRKMAAIEYLTDPDSDTHAFTLQP